MIFFLQVKISNSGISIHCFHRDPPDHYPTRLRVPPDRYIPTEQLECHRIARSKSRMCVHGYLANFLGSKYLHHTNAASDDRQETNSSISLQSPRDLQNDDFADNSIGSDDHNDDGDDVANNLLFLDDNIDDNDPVEANAPSTPAYLAREEEEEEEVIGDRIPWRQRHETLHSVDYDSFRARILPTQLPSIGHFWDLCSRGANFKKDKDLMESWYVQLCERPVPVFVQVGSDSGQEEFINKLHTELSRYVYYFISFFFVN